jgi:hypothetical protein
MKAGRRWRLGGRRAQEADDAGVQDGGGGDVVAVEGEEELRRAYAAA